MDLTRNDYGDYGVCHCARGVSLCLFFAVRKDLPKSIAMLCMHPFDFMTGSHEHAIRVAWTSTSDD